MTAIRHARADDAAAIAAVVAAAFGQADEAELVARLRAEGHVELEMVAERDGALLGHVLYSRLVAPPGSLALAPVSVAPAAQRQGIGSALIRASLAALEADGRGAVFVLGEPGYYGRFGFSAAAAAHIASPFPGPHFMARDLAPGHLAAATGAIVYPPPFGL